MSPKVTQQHREGKRKEIVKAAQRVFIRKGYAAATMKDVVEESGLSRGGVYLYFGSTEEMFLAMLESMDEENYAFGEEMVARHGSAWEAILALLGGLLEELKTVREGALPIVYEAFLSEWRRHTFDALLASRYERSVDRLGELLRYGVESGEFRPLLPVETLAKLLLSFNDGIVIGAMQFGAEGTDAAGQLEGVRLSLRHLLGLPAGTHLNEGGEAQ